MEVTPLEEKLKKLQQPFPKEATYQYQKRDGDTLTGLHSMYLINRLNDIMGVGKWRFSHEVVINIGQELFGEFSAYAVVKGSLLLSEKNLNRQAQDPSGSIVESSYQYGGHSDMDFGDAYKGATTDAFIKCAQWLGIGKELYINDPREAPKRIGKEMIDKIKKKLE